MVNIIWVVYVTIKCCEESSGSKRDVANPTAECIGRGAGK